MLAKQVAKHELKDGIKNYAENNIMRRLGKNMTPEMRKEFANDIKEVLGDLDQSPWEIALELVPVAGDIYGAAKFGKDIAKAYGRLQDIENKYAGKILKSLPKEQQEAFKNTLRRAGVRDARKDNLDGSYSPGKGLEGHHKDYVKNNPEKASDPRNIEFKSKEEHIKVHQENP